MSERFHARDGRRLAYQDSGGDGPPVLCLAGLTRNASDFAWIAGHLAERYRVIRLDSRGRGESEWAEDPVAEYQVPVEARDAVALLDHLGIARAALIGTSRGGILGMTIGATDPGRLSCLVLNDVGPVVEPAGLAKIMGYLGMEPGWSSFSEAATALAQSMGAAFPDLTGEQWLSFARTVFADEEGRPRLTYDPRLREAVAAGLPPADLWHLFDCLRDVPILTIRGENSDILSAETLAEMQRRRPDMAAVTVPDRGHVPFLDEPEAVDAIDAFLAAHAR